jgi:serine/threonine-protein kinase
MPIEVGQLFAGYTVVRVLGAGGMGAVYLASHPRLPRQDALKVLPTNLTTDPEFRGRFEREAEMAAQLSHPNIVGIHDRGEYEGQFWISMEYVAGTDAARLLLDQYPGGMSLDEAASIIGAMASALDYAHHRGLLHRDVKPANILLADPDRQGRRIYLADFGIARPLDDAAGLTATNMTVGTVFYSAPEQLRGESIDGRADQYALACTAFHLLTGRPPYGDSNPAVVISRHVAAPVPRISVDRPELAALDPVFARAMAKDRSARFGTCREFADQLLQHRTTGPTQFTDVPLTNPRLAVTAPTLPLPPQPRRRTRRTGVLVGAVGAAAVLIAGAGFAVVKLTDHPNPVAGGPPPAGTPTKAMAPNTGPFTGVYKVDLGPISTLQGQPAAGMSATTETWAVRSVCGGAGCVATASRINGHTLELPTMVLDKVGERWQAVGVGTTKCNDVDGEIWEAFTLQTRPDGVFAGDVTQTIPKGCANMRTVTFTRTKDVDVSSLPDPAVVPPRVASPGEALRGRYHNHRNYHAPRVLPYDVDYGVTTQCLRTGDRCVSRFVGPSGEESVMAFGTGKWVLDSLSHSRCATNGAPLNITNTGQFELPQPPQNPIAVLSGRGRRDQAAPCALSIDFDETFMRTGD